ncbi:hypothetical protein ROZALSC1DRAFT_30023, partial [Rozella allomycis CSF55]
TNISVQQLLEEKGATENKCPWNFDLVEILYSTNVRYQCGPTVYDDAHIGHARNYITFDIIRRILEKNGYQIIQAMNMTDIDDKIIKRASETGISTSELAHKYEKRFMEDMNSLNILKPTVTIRVTENIERIQSFIKGLIDKNVAYSTSLGNVYFNCKKYLQENTWVFHSDSDSEYSTSSVTDKINASDFALWKSLKVKNEKCWPSPWGDGRPGWHIECSVLSSLIFGSKIDLHTGGSDLKFPHHENEIAQCKMYHEDEWCKTFLHSGHLLIDGEKMSKSLGNFVTVRVNLFSRSKKEFLTKMTSNQLRIMFMSCKYQKMLQFNKEQMDKAVHWENQIMNLIETEKLYKSDLIADKNDIKQQTHNAIQEMNDALCDDFNTPKMLSLAESHIKILTQIAKSEEITTSSLKYCVSLLITELESVGLAFSKDKYKEFDILVGDYVNLRNDIRDIAKSCTDRSTKEKLYETGDNIRKTLENKHKILIRDQLGGSTWRKK